MENHKNLNLKRESIDDYINSFSEQNSLTVRENTHNGNKKRVVIGRVGIDDAMIDIHLNQDGTTTINHKVGKNQELGASLSQFLYNTIDPNEFININFRLKGIDPTDINPILDELRKSVDETENNEFQFEDTRNNSSNITKIQSIAHNDTITVTHHPSTRVLQIQGKPLFTYRRIIYLLSELLDLSGLQNVLSRTENDTASIVRKEIAEDYLKMQLTDSYEKIQPIIRNLLLSSCCVKLASPQLPEYSMLLYPELRSLEGILKHILSKYGMYVDSEENGFGAFFSVRSGNVTLNQELHSQVDNTRLVSELEKAYSFFRKHRNGLFHMDEMISTSRVVDTLDKALSLTKDAYKAINALYVAEDNS